MDKIYVLARTDRIRPRYHPTRPILDDVVSILTLDGVEIEQLSVMELLLDSPYAYLLLSLRPDVFEGDGPALDVLHTNHVEVIRETAHTGPSAFRRGNLILSVRNINVVMVVDPATREIEWLWGPGNLTFQHHPNLLDNGNLLIFDNGTDRSRIVELNPLSLRTEWVYEADGFFSKSRGSVQRLPNGNSLITESDTGYVFEVDPSGDVVWQFVNPEVNERGRRMPIWRMTRVQPEALTFLHDPARHD